VDLKFKLVLPGSERPHHTKAAAKVGLRGQTVSDPERSVINDSCKLSARGPSRSRIASTLLERAGSGIVNSACSRSFAIVLMHAQWPSPTESRRRLPWARVMGKTRATSCCARCCAFYSVGSLRIFSSSMLRHWIGSNSGSSNGSVFPAIYSRLGISRTSFCSFAMRHLKTAGYTKPYCTIPT
jgi:hypothetical protein